MTNDDWILAPAALGTWAWGDSGEHGDGYFGSELDPAALDQLADMAHAAGLTLWDTALVYGMGRSEQVLGRVLQRFDRADYQLSTKFTPQIAADGVDAVGDMLERSLANLGTDYIDLYWIHNPADVTRWTPRLIPLLEAGTIKHVGVSNHDLAQIQQADRILGEAGFRVEAVQNHYSLLYRGSERAGILDWAGGRGIPFFAYMVLEQGALTGRYGPSNPLPDGSARAQTYNRLLPQLQALTNGLTEIGRSRVASAADVAVAWAIAKGTRPIVGVTKPQHIDGLVRARRIELTGADIEHLEGLADAADVDTRAAWEHVM
ncbi:aldo/keto reductase [Amnibacterium kyonggiense]|uniref:Aryl-alcohol dehydrogenase-like predicted oxidoreductase n=1 Tax=Amnibacterium kyonggiense TaxID=595671 RepID=A0A4R7FR79_9MICO|nr:aldo/keto reductase [Amnibacterium kyonggiense]TDS80310.1 aryl-alcohol dehydrogenase-like predicted oxidoreductase [Amnibacterium kyonggiense]